MLEFCPLCQKNGKNRKIILRQINLQEGVWLCEYSECPWPFGYQDFTFVPRPVGETWSTEWESRKPTGPKASEPFPISLNELGLDTPPVTPGSGSEVTHKDSAIGDSSCSATSLNSNTNVVVQTQANGSLKNCGYKLKQPHYSECASIDAKSPGTRLGGESFTSPQSGQSNDGNFKSRELLNVVDGNLRNKETPPEFKGGFSLSNEGDSTSLDKCLPASQGFIDACNAAEAVTESVFNVAKPSKDNLSVHESTVKCKKWLNDNTKEAVVRDHCHSPPESKKVSGDFKNVSTEGPVRKLQRNSIVNLNSSKRRPKIKSIEKTNVKLAEIIVASNQSVREKSKASSATEEKTSPVIVGNLTGIVKSEPQQDVTSTNADQTCKIENRTLVIDGLLPISISYTVPSSVEECTSVPWSTDCKDKVKEEIASLDPGQESVVDNSVVFFDVKTETADCAESKSNQSIISNKTDTQRQSMKKPLKRTIPKLAKYQGFNFGTLKKKSKTSSEENMKSSLPNLPSPDNVSCCSDLTWTSEVSCATTATADSKSESFSSGIYCHSKSTLSIESCSPATSSSDLKSSDASSPKNDGLLEPIFNFDDVLDDLMLSDNEDLTKGLGDDWLVSLFN